MTQTAPFDIEYFQKKEHYLEVINRFATLLLNAKTTDDIVWTVAKNAIAQLGYVDCVIYLLDDNEEYFIQRAAHGPKNPVDLDILNPIKIKLSEGIVGNVALHQKGEIISDTSNDPRYIFDNNMALSEISVPIIHNNKTIGVIDSEHPDRNFFPEDDLKTLSTIASMTASKLVEASYNQKIQEYQANLEQQVQLKTLELNQTLEELKKQTLEVTDSINYARRIQKAIFPNTKAIKRLLPNSFVFYKPKDIVAGDFYVCEKIEGKLIIAIADCTGHGVPGAIISIICNNAIRRAIKKTGILNAAKILDKTRDYVIQAFATSDENIQDGMDIALCIIDPTTYQLNYAGANISLHYTKQQKLVEVKSDKQPIGNYINKLPFTNHTVQLHQGDSIYLFTDGLPDQFGGAKGKKFKYKQLRELIASNTHDTLQNQETVLNRAFELWRGNLPQVDDICIIGVRP